MTNFWKCTYCGHYCTKCPENTCTNYKKNKKLAIDFTREFLKNTSEWLEYFENYKNKKDDLADAYLMIRYRLKTI